MSNPTLTTVTIVSNNTIKTNYAITGDEVTLSITASENINQPSVVFTSNSQSVNNSVTYSGSNTIWTAKYTVDSSDSNGDIGFTINFQSTGGNSGTAVTATTDSSSVNKVGVTINPPTSVPTTIGQQVNSGTAMYGGGSGHMLGYSCAISDDCQTVVAGGDKKMKVWKKSGSTLELTGNFSDNYRYGRSVSINGNGTIIAVGVSYYLPNNLSLIHI